MSGPSVHMPQGCPRATEGPAARPLLLRAPRQSSEEDSGGWVPRTKEGLEQTCTPCSKQLSGSSQGAQAHKICTTEDSAFKAKVILTQATTVNLKASHRVK